MRRAVCPHCGKDVYSADTVSDKWRCPYCGRMFRPDYEDELERGDADYQQRG